MNRKIVVILCIAAWAATTGWGAGYSLFEGSARGNVDPSGLIAAGGDPSVIYFNPAAMTGLPGTQVQAGISLVMPFASVETVNPYTGVKTKTEGKDKLWPIPSAYVTHQMNESIWLGFGIYARFGLGAEFPENWPGRYNSYKAIIQAVDLAPTIAWKINEKLSVSAGLTIRYFDIELAQKIDVAGAAGLRNYNDPAPSPYDVDQNLHGDDISFGMDFGIQFKPVETLSLGAAYHSRIRFVCKGDGDWTKPDAVQALLPDTLNDTRWSAKNYNPDEIMLAASWDATDRWTLSASAIYTLWSVYDNLIVDFNEPMLMGRSQITSVKNWNDVWRLNAGASYAINSNWTARTSYTFDESPLNPDFVDYFVPGDDRHLIALGLTWDKDTWTTDFSYFFEIVRDMDVDGRPQNGVFDGRFTDATAHAFAVSLTKRF
ncbi:MAG: outer membrane protein transport protein [Verrucomicrobiota bacterium]|jgi:long-chain fatty acid transport protein|nr:outer membrane protein transport protein [Verrucomicrobiota bacterium]